MLHSCIPMHTWAWRKLFFSFFTAHCTMKIEPSACWSQQRFSHNGHWVALSLSVLEIFHFYRSWVTMCRMLWMAVRTEGWHLWPGERGKNWASSCMVPNFPLKLRSGLNHDNYPFCIVFWLKQNFFHVNSMFTLTNTLPNKKVSSRNTVALTVP